MSEHCMCYSAHIHGKATAETIVMSTARTIREDLEAKTDSILTASLDLSL